MTTLKIEEIRRAIFSAEYCRLDISGHTRSEFSHPAVRARIEKHLAAMKALQIKPRFVQDIRDRDNEIRLLTDLLRDADEALGIFVTVVA